MTLNRRQRGRIFFAGSLLIAGIIIMLIIPRPIWRILIYRTPGYDDYQLFNNKVIKTGIVRPWQTVPLKNQLPLKKESQIYLRAGRTFSFVVVHQNKIVKTYYSPDTGPAFRPNSYNLSQGLLSLLVGCAIHDGYLTSIDEPVSDFYPEFYQKMSQGPTIHDLLRMSSGLRVARKRAHRWPFSLEAYYAKDLDKRCLEMKQREQPGEIWHISWANAQLLAMILERVTNMSVADYLEKKMWIPLGCESPALWSVDDKGNVKAFCCFFATASDLARIGQLVLNEGEWNGKQIVDRNYLKQMITPETSLKKTNGEAVTNWGLCWWITTYRGHKVIFSRGQMGQYLIIVPYNRLIIVRQGELGSPDFTRINMPELYQLLDIAYQSAGLLP